MSLGRDPNWETRLWKSNTAASWDPGVRHPRMGTYSNMLRCMSLTQAVLQEVSRQLARRDYVSSRRLVCCTLRPVA